MARRHLLFAAAATFAFASPAVAGSPVPSGAGVILGSGNARMCYLAAESGGRTSEDIRTCNDAVIEERGDVERLTATHINRGILRLRRNDLQGALADFDMATRLNPDEPEAYLNRGSAMLRTASARDAVSQFDSAIAKQTRRPELAYFGRARAYEEAGNVSAAYRDYRRASELAPSWSVPRAELTRFRVVRN